MAEGRDGTTLAEMVQAQLPNADELMLRLVTGTVGLVAGVAWADGEYPEAEQRMVKDELSGIDAFSRRETSAICKLLVHEDIARAAGQDPAAWTGELTEVTDAWQRRKILDLLVDVAVADGDLADDEDRYLSAAAEGLGLDGDAYRESLERHPSVQRT